MSQNKLMKTKMLSTQFEMFINAFMGISHCVFSFSLNNIGVSSCSQCLCRDYRVKKLIGRE